MNRKRYFMIWALLAFLGFSFVYKEDLFSVSKNLDIFAALYKEININYVEETDASVLMKTGIDAMLKSMDPYTEFVPESEIENYRLKYVNTQFGGIGAVTLFKEGRLFINELSAGHPAYKADLRPGDEILQIDTQAIKGKDRNAISQLLRGPKGSPVKLQIWRDGKPLDKTLIREEIRQPNVNYASMLDNGIGYIRLTKFLEYSTDELRAALINIQKENPKGLILDLRNNGGGILQEAVKIVNLFVARDVLVVSQRARVSHKSIDYLTQEIPLAPDLPLVVLINGASASAAEIVAGALQDLDRAVILGQRSYGKGLVQQSFNLPYNNLLKVTVAKYYTPSGRSIQKLNYGAQKSWPVADSLSLSFKTLKGRAVYEHNGIYPDVFIARQMPQAFVINLINQSMFFDFANRYYFSHPKIAEAKDFKLTDQDYDHFIAQFQADKFTYKSTAERLLQQLKQDLEQSAGSKNTAAALAQLQEQLQPQLSESLKQQQAQIKPLLENQIVARYYFERGRIEQSMQYDEELKAAKALILQPQQMLQVLNGVGTFKSIGKPQHLAQRDSD